MISRSEQFIYRLNAVIEENLSDPHFGVNQLAEKMNLSRGGLWRKVRQLTNLTPTQFIKIKRLEKARHMIMNDVATIYEISQAVGISDTSYFAKIFNKQFGVLPSKYVEHLTPDKPNSHRWNEE